MTRLWIRLCAAILQHWLIVLIGWSEAAKISFAKLASLISKMACQFAIHLGDPRDKRVEFFQQLLRRARCQCKRPKKPGAIELLNDPSLLDCRLTRCLCGKRTATYGNSTS